MGEEGLCEEVVEAILKMGFKRKASFAHAFVDSNVFEDWLTRFKLKLDSFKDLDDAEWAMSTFSPGRLVCFGCLLQRCGLFIAAITGAGGSNWCGGANPCLWHLGTCLHRSGFPIR